METWEVLASIKEATKGLDLSLGSPLIIRSEDLPVYVLQLLQQKDRRHMKHICANSKKEHFLLEEYGPGFWVKWPYTYFNEYSLPKKNTEIISSLKRERGKRETLKTWEQMKFKELLYLWSEEPKVSHKVEKDTCFKLDMKPPDMKGQSKVNVDHSDPKEYIENKYYEALFSIHVPLAYFVKSNLVRVKNTCRTKYGSGSYKIAYQAILQKFLLSIVQFNDRHDNRLLLEPFGSPIADEKRNGCLTKFVIQSGNNNGSTVADLCVIFKSREIKLQILLLLEIIGLNNLDCNFKDFEKKYKSKLKKRSLNLTKQRLIRRRPKKAIKQQNKDIEKIATPLDYCEQLDLYLDRACILDILLSSETPNPDAIEITNGTIQEHKNNILNKNKEASLVGFINYVLIPYFTKKVPHAVDFIIQKLKGPSMRPKRAPKKITDTTGGSSPSTAELYNKLSTSQRTSRSSLVNSVPSSPALNGTEPNIFSRKSITTPIPELLNFRTNSNLNEFLESETRSLRRPSQLGRTKSDLTMNHLQKRQFSVSDLSKSRIPSPSTIPLKTTFSRTVNGVHTSTNNSFRRVGKRKDINETVPSNESIDPEENVQVQATPAAKNRTTTPNKRAQLQSIVESPLNPKPDTLHEGVENPQRKISPLAATLTKTSSENNSKRRVRRRLFAP
ncbi:DNA replication regulator sld3 [Saccharomyces pastorianus]|uniref:DNA replication regulator sld3 n=1 Tax=Saccharomyces pastorianus TaxID=27292 RepID=A0A6C1E6N9_SACPS|nr:DNA replication regulator sld3 [Saccharomyces pastorianus]